MPQTTADNRTTAPLHELDLRDEKDLIDFVAGAWREGKNTKWMMEHLWALRLAHLAGDQWLEYDHNARAVNWTGSGRASSGGGGDGTTTRLTVNLLQGYVQSAVARWSRGDITWASVPATNSPDDQDRSEHHDRVLRFLWRDLGMRRKWVEALLWVAVCHNCFLQCGWDPDAGSGTKLGPDDVLGPPGEEPEEGQPPATAEGQDAGWSDRINQMLEALGVGPENLDEEGGVQHFEGANTATVVAPFELIPEPHADSLSDANWVIRSRRRTIEYLLERYPKAKKEIEGLSPGGADDGFEVYYKRPTAGRNRLGSETGDYEEAPSDTVLVHELWHVPSETYPQGVRAVVSGDEVLYLGDNPYQGLPFVQLREAYVPGEFWATGALEQAIPVQEAINGIASKLIEILGKTAGPWYAAAKTAGIDWDQFTAEAGVVVEVRDPQRDVRQFDPPSAPAYIQALQDDLKEALKHIFGDFDVSRGKDTSKATSGRAINLLQEANDLRAGPVLDGFQDSLQRFGSMQLWIAGKYWREERQIWVAGDLGERTWHSVSGSDLIGADAGSAGLLDFDVEVRIERRRSVAAAMEQIDFLTARGYLRPDNPNHQALVLSALQFSGVASNKWDETAEDRAKANQENQALLSGEVQVQGPSLVPPLLVYGDDDSTHLRAHLRGMITSEFERKVKEQPELRMAFLVHVAEHQRQAASKAVTPQVLAQQTAMQMMAQAGIPPEMAGPGGPGGGERGGGEKKEPQPAGRPSGGGGGGGGGNNAGRPSGPPPRT